MLSVPAAALDRISECWNDRHWIGRAALSPEISAERVLSLLTDPNLHWPYLTLVRSSSQPAVKEFTDAVPGFRQRVIDPDRLRELVGQGYTMKFQRLEDFDGAVRAEVAAFQAHFGLATTAYAFVTPTESRGLSFHRDASHVLAVQLEGHKEWEIVRPTAGANPNAGLEPDPQGERFSFVLAPGDMLYLPHGWPHRARTASDRSTHLTFTLSRPHPYALASQLLGSGAVATETIAAAATDRLGL
ncbi:JmjC domain-containing protein [Kitasatospora azatica]|uniref:JmjC domain-containing protein n=1 Tax=Kitasatospora azatica TaxID=58347 RepID=UPI0005602508|nr:cupin domain-containing protein [Kitasatospora azatica]